MIRSSVRSAGLALLLTMGGCGSAVMSDSTGAGTPGLNVAEAALQGGSGQIALQVSDGVLRESPNDVHALEIKGDALTLLGDYDQAGAIFQALLAKDPNSVRAGIGLGRVRLAKDPAAAEVLFQQVLKHDPRNITALNNLGIARDLQGHHAAAQPAYRQALAINPDLESAQVNLALSMAMNGQGPAAIKLLQTKAIRADAPAKVKHDYAVVLAMAGKRSEAERVLSDDMAPEDARRLLDSATGTHSPPAAPANDAVASAQRDDDVPPDVVQVPEASPPPAAPGRTARTAAAPIAAVRPTAMAATLAAPPPMVVHPQAVADPDADRPSVQPVNPVAAAVINQQPLSLPIHGAPPQAGPVQRVADAAPAIVKPEVVAMPPPAQPIQRVADPMTGLGPIAWPASPQPQPAPQPAPPPPAARPQTAAARVAPQATPPQATPRPVASQVPAAPLASGRVAAAAAVVPVHPAPVAHAAMPTGSDPSSTMVQFAATPSEQSAHSFWQVLVHRFPDALAQREPVVVRFEHDGAVFWRVRAEGFASLSEAQNLCAKMRAGGQACFVPRS
jgi:Flp pilus assembly protein TadD